ncbi:hypothetical protein [Streptomyces triticisoli]|uniref:hypothetical protein n=1 Tax=Streptomyces triticisoli TaxID=2182797 RepID=UPI000DD88EA2|nr:hypothetical protein [Streptomyces triticisoli]
MRGKRHGAMGAALALLTLLAALFCATSGRSVSSVASAPSTPSALSVTSAAERSSPATAAVSSVTVPTPDTADHGDSAVAGAPCSKKVVPEQPQVRADATLISSLPAGAGETAWARGSPHAVSRHCGPAPSPPDLTELSVRRV